MDLARESISIVVEIKTMQDYKQFMGLTKKVETKPIFHMDIICFPANTSLSLSCIPHQAVLLGNKHPPIRQCYV